MLHICVCVLQAMIRNAIPAKRVSRLSKRHPQASKSFCPLKRDDKAQPRKEDPKDEHLFKKRKIIIDDSSDEEKDVDVDPPDGEEGQSDSVASPASQDDGMEQIEKKATPPIVIVSDEEESDDESFSFINKNWPHPFVEGWEPKCHPAQYANQKEILTGEAYRIYKKMKRAL